MTCFVRLKEPNHHGYKMKDIVKKVEFKKHSTFANSRVPITQWADNPCMTNVNRLPWSRDDELTWSDCVWGYFEVPVTIYWKIGDYECSTYKIWIDFDRKTTFITVSETFEKKDFPKK